MCSLERVGSVLVLRLTGEGEHRLTEELCAGIRGALARAEESDARALVTTNDGKFFCNGLDVGPGDGDDGTAAGTALPLLVRELELIALDLLKLSMPTYAAVCGHAAGGGLLLALAHDHRLMRSDRGFLLSPAADIGFVLPPGSAALYRAKAPPRAFKDLLLSAARLTGPAALAAGLVDSVHDGPAATLAAAVSDAARFAARPRWRRPVFAALRASMYPDLFRALEHEHEPAAASGGFLPQ